MNRLQRIQSYNKIIQNHQPRLKRMYDLIQINRGNLLPYVVQSIYKQFKEQSADIARERIPPINVLKRIIKKMTVLYNNGVMREVIGGQKSDADLLNEINKTLRPDRLMHKANMYVNLCKYCLIQPILNSQGKPAGRIIRPDCFIPLSNNALDPENPTGYLILMDDNYLDDENNKTQMWMKADETELIYFTTSGKDVTAEIDPENNGLNPLGYLPMVYLNQEGDEELIPTEDTDSFQMSVLIPAILTDINFAHMFQAFSILYTIDADEQELVTQPNAVWRFKSNPGDEKTPQVGTIETNADISAGIDLVANQFAMWLNTKGIKPGDIGEINGSNFSSGISKILDEMDTVESVKDQIGLMLDAENDLFELVLKKLLNNWNLSTLYRGPRGTFTPTATVKTTFPDPMPMVRRSQVLDEQIKELNAGLTTKNRVLRKLNPKMTDAEITELEAELDDNESDENETDDQIGA